MKGVAVIGGIVCFVVALIVADFLFTPAEESSPVNRDIPFSHALHGANIGLDCTHCHSGARSGSNAFFPSKADCMDCHRLPLTEKPGIAKLDSALLKAGEHPWRVESAFPSDVVFHHGIHVHAGLSCESCHGSPEEIDRGRRAPVRMENCVACHRKEIGTSGAMPDCAWCHR